MCLYWSTICPKQSEKIEPSIFTLLLPLWDIPLKQKLFNIMTTRISRCY